MKPNDDKPRLGYSLYLVLLATVGLFLARLPLLARRTFDPDEFEHVHAAWCMFKGLVPYKDFFEHHTPWYYYLLRPFFRWFDVAGSFESARNFLVFGRGLSLLLTMVAVVIVAAIGRAWRSNRVGILAAFLLVGQPVFMQKTVEMRPDVLALCFFVACLYFLVKGMAVNRTGSRLRTFLAGGLALGAAIMCTQKMLFALPGTFAGLGLWALLTREPPDRPSRVRLTFLCLGGVLIPGALTWAAFAYQNAGGEFIANNFILNSQWKHVVYQQVYNVLETSWPMLVLALLGGIVTGYRTIRAKETDHAGWFLIIGLFALIAGILYVPVAHKQYYLMILPLACLLAAYGLTFLIDLVSAPRRPALLVVSLLPLSVLPLLGLREAMHESNERQVATLREVFATTQATDLVMDGWRGTGVFRPHAFHYYFLHEELLDMLPRPHLEAFLGDLETGRVKPRLIALDDSLASLGSRFIRFVRRHYESRDGFLYYRRSESD